MQRAIGLIVHIKNLHDNDQWEASTEHYQPLRAMLSDVIYRSADKQTDVRAKLSTARAIIGRMENFVRPLVSSGISEHHRSRLNRRLIGIQSELEELASDAVFGNSQGRRND